MKHPKTINSLIAWTLARLAARIMTLDRTSPECPAIGQARRLSRHGYHVAAAMMARVA